MPVRTGSGSGWVILLVLFRKNAKLGKRFRVQTFVLFLITVRTGSDSGWVILSVLFRKNAKLGKRFRVQTLVCLIFYEKNKLKFEL
jgi:hypothetical protein